MRDISVLYMSKVITPKGTGNRNHTHDYWHFNLSLFDPGKESGSRTSPQCYCYPAGTINPEGIGTEDNLAYNVMFLVHNPVLSSRLEAMSFGKLKGDNLHIPVLENIMEQSRLFCPTQDFIDFAFGYYIHLLMETYDNTFSPSKSAGSLVEKALDFIETNHMNPITLADVANYIERTPNYTSHLVKATTGMSVLEHIRSARIKHACIKLAYTEDSLDEIIKDCGFTDYSYFYKRFKSEVGTTPHRYRTSHLVKDTYYEGADEALDIPYAVPAYTYIPGARKCVEWKNPREYLMQKRPSYAN